MEKKFVSLQPQKGNDIGKNPKKPNCSCNRYSKSPTSRLKAFRSTISTRLKMIKVNANTYLWRFKVRSPPVTNAVINHPVLLNTILTTQYLPKIQLQSKLLTTPSQGIV